MKSENVKFEEKKKIRMAQGSMKEEKGRNKVRMDINNC